jgi:hypothetical protein
MKVDMEMVKEYCPEALTADGFNEAIIGFSNDIVAGCVRIVYDYEKMVEILVNRDKMSREEAVEFLDFNTVQAYMGKNSPIFVNKFQ